MAKQSLTTSWQFLLCAAIFMQLIIGTPSIAASDISLENFVLDKMHEYNVPGVSITIVVDNKVARAIYKGYANSDTLSKVNATTVFQVGSISKSVSAWAILRLVQEGKLDLDAPVSQYLSRWSLPESIFDSEKVTIRRILSHTSGLSLHGYSGFRPNSPLPTTIESLNGKTNGAGDVQLRFQPGTAFSYSGGGYTLLQLIVEEVTGKSFSEFIDASVLTPLNMRRSSYKPISTHFKETTKAYDTSLREIPNFIFAAQAAAGLSSTSDDLAKFMIANMERNPVLREQYLKLMHTASDEVKSSRYGLGFSTRANGGVIGHFGSNIGWKASMQFVPEKRAGIVILTNSESGTRLIRDVNCYWNEAFDISALDMACERLKKKQSEQEQLVSKLSLALSVSIFCVFAAIAYRKKVRNHIFTLRPLRSARTWLTYAILSLALLWIAFAHTTIGIKLFWGFPYVRGVDYLLPGFHTGSWLAIVFLVLLAGLISLRTPPKTSASLSPDHTSQRSQPPRL